MPELQWELARSYAGLGQIAAKLKDEDPTSLFAQAETERKAALEKSPNDARYQLKLNDLQ